MIDRLLKSPWLFLFMGALFPVVFLFAQNANELSGNEIWRAIGFTLGGVLILVLILRFFFKSLVKSALFVTVAFILFFSYGRITRFLKIDNGFFAENPLMLAGAIIAGSLLLLIILGWILKKVSTVAAPLIKGLNIMTGILLLVQIFMAAQILLSRESESAQRDRVIPAKTTSAETVKNNRDIYYIILDGYARSDVMRKLYSYDNTEFLNELEELGFYVADSSHSNYCHTFLSLGSTMNLDYISGYGNFDELSHDRIPAGNKLLHNRLVDKLKNYGYSFVSFASGLNYTEFEHADYYLSPPDELNSFERTLLGSTPLAHLMDYEQDEYDLHRLRIKNVFDDITELEYIDGPKFVFAHIIGPHPPFVYDRDGNPLTAGRQYTKADGNEFVRHGGSAKEYIEQYREEAMYLSKRTVEICERLVRYYPKDNQPIIIIQADHGPGSQTHWNLVKKTNMWERMSILNAYYLPDMNDEGLYRSITPVNSFRLVMNKYFNESYPLLPDSIFFSTFSYPYACYEVSDRVVSDRKKD